MNHIIIQESLIISFFSMDSKNHWSWCLTDSMDSMDCSDPLIHGHLHRLHPGKPAHRLRRCEANIPAELRADGFGAKWDDFMGFPPILLAKSGGKSWGNSRNPWIWPSNFGPILVRETPHEPSPVFFSARGKQPECKTRIHWLRGSRELIRGTALSVRNLNFRWVYGERVGVGIYIYTPKILYSDLVGVFVSSFGSYIII